MTDKNQNPDKTSTKPADPSKRDSSIPSNSSFETGLATPTPGSSSELMTVGSADGATSGSLKEAKKIAERLGHYEIVGELGKGGMGIVYKAFDPSLKRYVALKIIGKDNPEL